MEKFIKIARSISNLSVFENYKITRIDIQFMKRENLYYGFLELEDLSKKDTIYIEIRPDGSFVEE